MQESKVSKAVKSLVTLSTLCLCSLIVIYHAIEVQVHRSHLRRVYTRYKCSRIQVSRTSNLCPDTSGYNLYPGCMYQV